MSQTEDQDPGSTRVNLLLRKYSCQANCVPKREEVVCDHKIHFGDTGPGPNWEFQMGTSSFLLYILRLSKPRRNDAVMLRIETSLARPVLIIAGWKGVGYC